jgi:hypothetical protein
MSLDTYSSNDDTLSLGQRSHDKCTPLAQISFSFQVTSKFITLCLCPRHQVQFKTLLTGHRFLRNTSDALHAWADTQNRKMVQANHYIGR